jgi:Cu/Zn superoxide dismutase
MAAGALGLGVLVTLAVSPVAGAHPGGRTVGRPRAVADVRTAAATDPKFETDTRRTRVHVDLKDVHSERVAQVDIVALPHGGNVVTVRGWNLTPGFHGIHIHAVGVCDPAGAKPFASAGGHFNPTGQPEGMQAGAFPVLLAAANGEAQTEFTDGDFAIRDLLGPAGTAVVIHAAPDNYANIPPRYNAGGVAGPDTETQLTGDAGTRVACGVLSPSRIKPSPAASLSSHYEVSQRADAPARR